LSGERLFWVAFISLLIKVKGETKRAKLLNEKNYVFTDSFSVGASHIQAIEGEHILPISAHPGIVGTTTTASHNETKTKLVQQQLALILHAHKCSRKDTESSQTGRQVIRRSINDVTVL
jgi:hypothetical protein